MGEVVTQHPRAPGVASSSPAPPPRPRHPQERRGQWPGSTDPGTLAPMSDQLRSRAEANGGMLSAADVADAGLRSRDLTRLVRAGTLTRVAARSHLLTEVLDVATTPEERHRLTAMALVHSFDGRVAASHHSALAMHGLPFWRVQPDQFHVARISGRSSRRRGSLSIHEAYPATDGAAQAVITSPTSGLRAVCVGLAVIGTAMVDGEEAGVVAADAALHRQLVTRDELSGWLDRLRRRPGLATARRAIALADERSESVGETRTRLLLLAMPDLPEVTPQFRFLDERGDEWARADFLVGRRLVVEFDGRTKYRAAEGTNASEVAQTVWSEKRREDRIRAAGAGHVVVRLVWDDLDHPGRARAMVRHGLRQADNLPGVA